MKQSYEVIINNEKKVSLKTGIGVQKTVVWIQYDNIKRFIIIHQYRIIND